MAESSGSVTRRPLSNRGLIEGISYEYQMPVCEASNPIDFDGSFWDAVDPNALTKTAGKHGYVTLMGTNTAVFRADDDSVVVLSRHAGTKDFAVCSSA